MSVDVELDQEIKIDEKIKISTTEPHKYKVILLNDNQTPVEWVVEILKIIFNHSQQVAEELTLQIHNEGSGIAGIYNYEIAEQKSIETVNASRDKGFPLQVRIDKE